MKDIIIVTGALNGMGLEFVKQIRVLEDCLIWAIDYNKNDLDNIKDINNIKYFNIDLTKESEIKLIKDELEKDNYNVKILANCAGFGKFDHNENIDLDTKINMLDLNCKAYMVLIDYCLSYMKENSYIMNIASCAGFQPIPYINLYAATKSFVLSYSRALNRELKYRNIHVLTVCPYWTDTKFFDRSIDKNKKEVVINYSVMYNPKDVIKKAIKDLYNKKELSIYGFINNMQRILVKILPHSLVMKIWINQQKLDGTKFIRKNDVKIKVKHKKNNK